MRPHQTNWWRSPLQIELYLVGIEGWRRYMRKEKEEHEYRALLVAFSVVPREDNGDGRGRVFRWS